MAERKPLSKKIRYEVFKRDKFKCVYCGKSAPDAVLEVDHLKPVSKGGTNDMINLVTACRDCNRGKSNREISDNSIIKRQQAQMEELAERNEQLEMILKWREGLQEIKEKEHDAVLDYLAKRIDLSCVDNIDSCISKWILQFPIGEILDAIDIAERQYVPTDRYANFDDYLLAIKMIPRICQNRKGGQSNQKYYFNYLRKALKQNFGYVNERELKEIVDDRITDDKAFEWAKKYLKMSSSYADWRFKETTIFDDDGEISQW